MFDLKTGDTLSGLFISYIKVSYFGLSVNWIYLGLFAPEDHLQR